MSKSLTIDAARVELLLTDLRLPAMKTMGMGIADLIAAAVSPRLSRHKNQETSNDFNGELVA